MEQLFNLMLSCLIILSLSACGKQSGMEQSGQSENAEPIEHTIISQAEETTEPATGTESTKAQEGYTMTNRFFLCGHPAHRKFPEGLPYNQYPTC